MDPRQVAEQLVRMNTWHAQTWLVNLLDSFIAECKAYERNDRLRIIEYVAQHLADELCMELVDSCDYDTHPDSQDLIELWYERGHSDGEDGVPPNPRAYNDY